MATRLTLDDDDWGLVIWALMCCDFDKAIDLAFCLSRRIQMLKELRDLDFP